MTAPCRFTSLALLVVFAVAACTSTASSAHPSELDAGIASDLATTSDGSPTSDVPNVPDVPSVDVVPESPFAFALYGGVAPDDGPVINLTFFDDGTARFGFAADANLSNLEGSYDLTGGAAEVVRVRGQLEASGLLDVPEVNETLPGRGGGWRLAYARNGRVYRWTFLERADTPTALHEAIETITRAGYALEP